MTKYARIVKCGDSDQDKNLRVVDLFNPDDYNPKPTWGKTEDALIDHIFRDYKAAWQEKGEWFHVVPDKVQNSALFEGDRDDDAQVSDHLLYTNPDGTDGSGAKKT